MARVFRDSQAQMLGPDNKPLNPWIAQVDLERLVVWLEKQMSADVWAWTIDDLKKCCAE